MLPPQSQSHRPTCAVRSAVPHRTLALTVAAMLCAVLAGCASSSYRYPDELIHARSNGDYDAHTFKVPEPAADEVVVVINNNSGFGTHAGMFVGARLSDPAGNYGMLRRFELDWKGPTLRDYVEHQMIDGLRIQLFRFKLDPADIKIIDERVAAQGITVPLNCAAEVRDQIPNVGVFKALKPSGWLSPNELAEQLLPLIEGSTAVGQFTWPNGRPCREPQRAAAAHP